MHLTQSQSCNSLSQRHTSSVLTTAMRHLCVSCPQVMSTAVQHGQQHPSADSHGRAHALVPCTPQRHSSSYTIAPGRNPQLYLHMISPDAAHSSLHSDQLTLSSSLRHSSSKPYHMQCPRQPPIIAVFHHGNQHGWYMYDHWVNTTVTQQQPLHCTRTLSTAAYACV